MSLNQKEPLTDQQLRNNIFFEKHLINTVNELKRLGVTVWIVRPVPDYDQNQILKKLMRAAWLNLSPRHIGMLSAEYSEKISLLSPLFKRLEDHGAIILDIYPSICPDRVCLVADESGSYYTDSHHLSWYGALHFKETLRPVFDAIRDGR